MSKDHNSADQSTHQEPVIGQQLAQQLKISLTQVNAVIDLLDNGATVPFIARYRKEQTQGLDDIQLRQFEQQLTTIRQLQLRRRAIVEAIKQQGKLSTPLLRQLNQAASKGELEQLYLPFKSQRRSKLQDAREAGLEPLLDRLLDAAPQHEPARLASAFINRKAGYVDAEQVLDALALIVQARLAEHPRLGLQLRARLWRDGMLRVHKAKPRTSATSSAATTRHKTPDSEKFSDYFDYAEPIRRIPSHRALAILRGCNESVLAVKLELESIEEQIYPALYQAINLPRQGRCSDWLKLQCQRAWRSKLQPQLQKLLLSQLQEEAESEAIRVFGVNLKQLLLAAPAGRQATLALDPGFRNGVKVAAIDATGKLLDSAVIYPHPPQQQWQAALAVLKKLSIKHAIQLIAVGNGTASRETDQLVSELLNDPQLTAITKVMVSEAGASVYSASELASHEFPDLDVSIRGAISIGRRLQDPLAELVKIDPKAIGVGQYQHDVDQKLLAGHLGAVVEDCVNAVGVDLNSASAPLLQYVSGINTTLAQNIVEHRNLYGPFSNRTQLKKVPRLGAKAFEQAAGFLRISGAKQPLDNSAVHPEAYPLVQQIAGGYGRSVASLVGDDEFLKQINPADFARPEPVTQPNDPAQAFDRKGFGLPTVTDILAELAKPGRDPRPEFRVIRFAEGINSINDLEPDMRLDGVVTNVTNFGAFVDIGVHQDGLVHISQLADRYVKDPHQVVKPGDAVTVRVLEIDQQRRRIALTIKSV
ncbi:MAG: Tex family protein [Motiliproteus sp.]